MLPRRSAIAAVCAAVIIPITLPAQTPTRPDTARTRDSTLARSTAIASRGSPTSTATRSSVLLQQRPTTYSQQRVRLQKDYRDPAQDRADSIANAERVRRDSIDRARQDSINLAGQRERDAAAARDKARSDSIANVERMRQDSINAANAIEAARRDSIARADSIAAAGQGRRQGFVGSSWHVGLAAGAAAPTGDFKNIGYNSGFDIAVPIEWHRPGSFLGVRMDLGYSQFNANTFQGLGSNPTVLATSDPKVISAALNLTGHVPLTESRSVSLYAMGGAGVYHFRSVGATALGGFLGNDVFTNPDPSVDNNLTKLGAQGGGGIKFGIGRTSLFVESRLVNVFADRDENVQFRDFFGDNRSKSLRWVPISIGVTIR